MDIAFRVDASKKTGIGHLMRCIALSEELNKRGNKCYFISYIEGEDLKEKVKKTSNFLHEIKKPNDLEEDLKYLIKFCKKQDISWVITDSYDINSNYLKKIKKNGFKLLSIDDTAQNYYYSDIVVNQNIGAEKLNIEREKHTKLLLGPRYVMLRDEILNNRTEKKFRTDVKNLLITLGGVDDNNYTLKILKQIKDLIIKKIIVIGALNPHYKKIEEYAKNKTDIKLITSPKNMVEIYQKTDIAISAGGTTCYELAYFGIPNVIITVADNQLNIAKELDKKNVSIYLGKKEEFFPKELKDNLLTLINNSSLREQMIKNGMELVDGNGKKRIIEAMNNLK